MTLWLRHVKAPQVAVAAFSAMLLIALLVEALPAEEGTVLPIRSLWLALAFSVPAVFVFTTEDEWDRISVRPVRTRRALLVVGVSTVSFVAAAAFFPTNVWDSGSAAMMRNCLGLIGAGLLSLMCLPRWSIWVTPTIMGIASMVFSVPVEPGTTMSLWGALRMSGGLHNPAGALDLSWPLCLIFFVIGAGSYIAGFSLPGRREHAGNVAENRTPQRMYGGINRAMLLLIISVIVVISLWWTPIVSIGFWGGSVQLLLTSYVPLASLFAAPVACACGVVAGQYRWRSSLSIWEKLSGRGQWAVLRVALEKVGIWVVPATVGSIIVLTALCVAGQFRDGVSSRIVRSELIDGAPNAVAASALVIVCAVLGTFLGFSLRWMWIPPVALLMAFLLVIPAIGLFREDDFRPWGGDQVALCEGVAPTVCAHPRDSAYLPAISAAVREVYAESGFRAELPAVVKVVDNSQFGPRVYDAPAVGLAGMRGVHAPQEISLSTVRQSLFEDLSAACRPQDLSRAKPEDLALPMMEGALAPYPEHGSPLDPEVVSASLHRARECYQRGGT